MSELSDEEYNKAKNKELLERATKSLSGLGRLTFLEMYGLFMARAQILELSIKKDLQEKLSFTVEQVDLLPLGALIDRLVKIGAHPGLIVHLRDLKQNRNKMAHEFLAVTLSGGQLAGSAFLKLSTRDLERDLLNAEIAFQYYSMLREDGQLYPKSG